MLKLPRSLKQLANRRAILPISHSMPRLTVRPIIKKAVDEAKLELGTKTVNDTLARVLGEWWELRRKQVDKR